MPENLLNFSAKPFPECDPIPQVRNNKLVVKKSLALPFNFDDEGENVGVDLDLVKPFLRSFSYHLDFLHDVKITRFDGEFRK